MTPSPYQIAVAARLRLSVAQSAALKAITGELLTRAELGVWRTLTGTLIAKPRPGGYRECWIRAGRRSGKSLHVGAPLAVSALLGDYEAILAPGERARVTLIAPTLPHLKQLFDGIAGVLRALNVEHVRRENEIEVVGRRTLAIGAVADALGPRGGTSVLVIIDEGALLPFTPDADGFDEEVLASARPSLATTGGRLIVLSSPWGRQGAHFTTIEKFLGRTSTPVLALSGSTWTWNPSLSEARTRELEANEGRWRREYLAVAGDNESSAFASADVARAIARGVTERPPAPGLVYGAAGDLAFRADGAVLGIAHRELRKLPGGPPLDRLVVDLLRVRRAPIGGRIDPEALIEEWASALKRYKVRVLHLDSFGFDLAASRFKARGIRCELLGMSLPQQMVRFDALGGRLRASTISIVDSDIARRELCDLRATLLAGGQVRFEAPKRGSDDTADVLAALCAEGTRSLSVVGGDVGREVRVRFDPADGGLSIDEKWFEEVRGPGGFVTRMPALPPRGTPAWDRLREERNALGIRVPEDFEDEAKERAANAMVFDNE